MSLYIAGHMPHLDAMHPRPKAQGAGARVNDYSKPDLFEVSAVDRKAWRKAPRRRKKAVKG